MNFDDFITVDDWTAALDSLIRRGTDAVRRQDADEVGIVQDLLLQFRQKSPPSFNFLDTVATKAFRELNEFDRNDALQRLEDLSRELSEATGLLNAAAERARLSAEAIQLNATLDALTKARASLRILQNLRAELTSSDSGVDEKISRAAALIEELLKELK